MFIVEKKGKGKCCSETKQSTCQIQHYMSPGEQGPLFDVIAFFRSSQSAHINPFFKTYCMMDAHCLT